MKLCKAIQRLVTNEENTLETAKLLLQSIDRYHENSVVDSACRAIQSIIKNKRYAMAFMSPDAAASLLRGLDGNITCTLETIQQLSESVLKYLWGRVL